MTRASGSWWKETTTDKKHTMTNLLPTRPLADSLTR